MCDVKSIVMQTHIGCKHTTREKHVNSGANHPLYETQESCPAKKSKHRALNQSCY